MGSVVLAIYARLLLDPILGNQFPFAILFFAVLLTAWYGGLGPAICSVVLGGMLSDYFLLPPRGSFQFASRDQLVGLLLYLATGASIALLGGGMHRSRRKAELVADAAQRQAVLIDQTHDAVLVWEWKGPIVFWSRGAERIYGFSKTDAIGRVSHELLRTEQPGGLHHFLEILERDGVWNGELEHFTRDGQRIMVESRHVLVRDSGTPYVLETNRDITIRRRAQEALRESHEQLETRVRERTAELTESEESFRLLVEGTKDYAIFMLDATGIIQTWNSGAQHIEGFAAPEIVGKPYATLFTPEDVAKGRPESQLRQAAQDGKVEVEGWRVRKDGSQFWVTGTLMALYDDAHGVRGFTKIARDLTARRRNDEMLRSVMDHTLDAIVCIDEHGIVSLFNLAAEKMFGRTAAETIGQNVRLLMPEPHQTAHDSYLSSYIQTGHAKIIGVGRKVEALRKNGSVFPADLAITEFVLDGQRQFVGILTDLSETHKLEEQLRQAQKLEAIGELAGGVAHDFNNLLTVILGYNEMLRLALPKDHPERESITAIQEAGEQAAALTGQLLAFSRQTVLEPRVLNVNTVVAGTQKMLLRLIGEDVVLASSLDPAVGLVKVDPAQLGQVLINLAINARDAMPKGGKLTIETANVDLDAAYVKTHPGVAPGRYVAVMLSDTGSGMTPEVRSRIFEPFFTTKSVGKGTGLGLAVVHGIVKQSGGLIEVYSELGLGTTFKLYFPRVDEQMETQSGEAASGADLRGRETILVVEDEERVRTLVVTSLRASGYRVVHARNGQEAVQILAQHRAKIDLLATDVVMPEMSGRELAEHVLRIFPETKVLYLSGYTDDAVVRHGILQAEVNFLQKPFTPLSLLRKIRQVLDAPV